jgi:hypothetical protein
VEVQGCVASGGLAEVRLGPHRRRGRRGLPRRHRRRSGRNLRVMGACGREGRIEGDGMGRRGTKPLTSQLAAVEAAEQAQNFRVAGGVLAGIGEEGCWRGEIEGWPR